MSQDNQHDKPKMEAEGHIPARYEASYLNLWTIILTAVILVVVIGIVHLLATAIFGFFAPADAFIRDPVMPGDEPGRSALLSSQANLTEELRQLREGQNANLQGYEWRDQEQGVVRIPIERAMQIVAERGRPEFAEEGEPVALPEPGSEGEADPAQMAAAGERLFQTYGCGGCHGAQDSPVAPTLVGIAGDQRTLASGETVTADEAYLQESILHPEVRVVQGYQPIMPSFQGRVTGQELQALVAYIMSLE